jgi:hypothetical protein
MAATLQFSPGITPDRLSPTARMMLQGIVAGSGLPSITVTSTHRDPFGNDKIGGAKGSQHIFGNAIDVDVRGLSEDQKRQFLDAAIQNGARGVGIYSSGNIIHVDVRPNPTFWGPDPAAPYAGQPVEKAPAWAQASLQRLFSQGGGYVAPPPTLASIRDNIMSAANAFNIDPALMMAIARKESGYNPAAENSRSTAKGLFQFIDGTWEYMKIRYGKQLGMPDDASPKDPKWASVMAAAMLTENKQVMERNIGRAVTPGELYLGQFLGAGGASSMIKIKDEKPDAPAALIFAGEAVANPSIFYDKEGNPRSVSQVYNLMTNLDLNAETNLIANAAAAQTQTQAQAQASAEAKQNAAIGNSVSYTPVAAARPAIQQLNPTQKLGTDMEQAIAARVGNTQRGLLG